MGNSGSKITPFTSATRAENVGKADLPGINVRLENRVKELELELQLKEEACKTVEEKLFASEEQVESLHGEVSSLQECLAAREDKTSSSRSSSALEHMVTKLEEELTAARDELIQMKELYERRLQRVRSSSAKSQAESALSLFELRDENQRLTQENARLLEQVRQGRESSSDDCGHMQLIIDLSQQLSTQEAELSRAREVLRKYEAMEITES